ncbi:MAG: hypothetical protein ACR2OR_01055, partial [Hyphomicrobiales bacterium]
MAQMMKYAVAFATCLVFGAAVLPTSAVAQQPTIEINIRKAGFVVGVSGGNGTLFYQGKSYPLSVGGMSLGLTIGLSKAQMIGEVEGLKTLTDIQGTYGRIGASAAAGVGGQNMLLENG